MGFWGGTLRGLMGSGLSTGGATAALSSGDIVLKVGGTILCISGAIVAYSGLVEDTAYENVSPQRLVYNSLRGLYKRLRS